MANLYEYAVLCNEKRDKDGEVMEKAEIVVEPTTVLARDENQAGLIAAQAIPKDYMDGKLDRIAVVVRPF